MNDVSLLHDRVRNSLESAGIADFEVLECAPELADTAEFCSHYGIAAEDACNSILVAVKTTPRRYVACLVRADTKLDVNRKVSELVGVKRVSFASGDETVELTGQMIGGVSVVGVPDDMPIYLDHRVLERDRIVVGGGNRSSKIRLAPQELLKLPHAIAVEIAVPR